MTIGVGHTYSQNSNNDIRPVFDENFDHWPVTVKSNGRIVVNRGLSDFKSLKRFLGRLSKVKKLATFADESDKLAMELTKLADQTSPIACQHQLAVLTACLKDADTVYLSGAAFTANQILALKSDFSAFLDRGGNLIFDGSLGELLGAKRRSDSESQALNLMPDCLVDCTFDGNEQAIQDMIDRVSKRGRSVGVCVEPNSMLVLSGRQLFSFGSGSTTLVLPRTASEATTIKKLGSRRTTNQSTRIDLTQWRRMAIDQTLPRFPPTKPKIPFVENGTLYIVGGGGTPKGLMSEMIEKAGGTDKSSLVYVPCSESNAVNQRQGTVEMWKRLAVKRTAVFHTKDRNKANEDEDFLKPLEDATMLWFGGGRQWNFADSYYGTKAHQRMKEVLHRGGVVGGSSAGASIQGRFLARATPIGNSNILAPGYERGGLGFLSGVAIDQHFTQRGRQKDMTKLIQKYPQLLGIGIDESTAIVVEKSTAKVIGRGNVYFYDANKPVDPGQPHFDKLSAGGAYDLAKRKIIKDD